MRPLIYVDSSSNNKLSEVERLSKSIKGSLEAKKIKYTTNVFSHYDLVHFINSKNLKKISDARRQGLPVIVSALYCEIDDNNAMSGFKSQNLIIKSLVKKCLNNADLVLVPGIRYKELLETQGVLSKIDILPIPINFKRFENLPDKVNKSFYKHFEEFEDNKFVLAIGDFNNKLDIQHIIDIAKLSPFVKFYFLGINYSKQYAKKLAKKATSNLVFSRFVEDDVYRSAMVNASIFLVIDYRRVETIAVPEAMAAKTQVVAFSEDKKYESFLKDKNNCYLGDGIYEVVNILKKLIHEEIKPTINKAYENIKSYNLFESGTKLKEIYSKLIKEKKENKA